MNDIFLLIKKELRRYFTDKRLVITTLLLPGLMIYLIYTLMGGVMSGITDTAQPEHTRYSILVYNMPNEGDYRDALYGNSDKSIPVGDKTSFSITSETVSDAPTLDRARTVLSDGNYDAIVYFAPDFQEPNQEFASVIIYGDSGASASGAAASLMKEILSSTAAYPIRMSSVELIDESGIMSMIMSMVLPLIVITMLFSGAMAVVPESIAGEKERGTIATLLVTPISRAKIAMGKILAMSVVALLCALSSCLGIALSLPKLLGGMKLDVNFVLGGYFALFGIILATELVIVGLLCILSASAKSVKEATSYSTPLVFIFMIIAVVPAAVNSFGGGFPEPLNTLLYLVPIWSSSVCIGDIVGGNINNLGVLFTIISNLAAAAALVPALTKMFNSERVMFNK